MKQPVWVLRETVLALHEQSLSMFGGATGIRDVGLLDSALARPENLSSHGTPSVFDLAASDAFGLSKNHPFVDGNKRVAFIVAGLFLQLNGYRLVAGEADATVQTLALAAGALKERGYARWLKANSARHRSSS